MYTNGRMQTDIWPQCTHKGMVVQLMAPFTDNLALMIIMAYTKPFHAISVTSTLRQDLPAVHQENNTFHKYKFWIQI